MKIKAFSFERDSLSSADIKSNVTKKLTDEAVYFESFKDPNALFNAVSDALSKANVILIGVEEQLYLKFKPIVIKAFSFTPAYSEKIEQRINGKLTDEKLLKAHLLVPDECTELLSESGLYSGFYVCSNGQYILVFPLNSSAYTDIFDNARLPFVKPHEDRAELLESLTQNGASEKAVSLIKKLTENGIKLAVSSTPAASLFKDDIRAAGGYESNIFFTPFVNDTGAGDKKDYAAELAKGSLELRNAHIGAAVSNIFRERDGDEIKSYYAFISIATEEKTVIRRLIADGGENVESLIVEATAELYSLIEKYTDELIFKMQATEDERKKYEAAQIEAEFKADARPAAALGKKGTVITVTALAAAVVICIILGFKFGGYFVSPSDDPEESQLQTNLNSTMPNPSLNNAYSVPNDTETETLSLFTSQADTTSIFDVSVTLPEIDDGNDDTPVYSPTPNTTKKNTESTTKKHTTTTTTTPAPKPKPSDSATQATEKASVAVSEIVSESTTAGEEESLSENT